MKLNIEELAREAGMNVSLWNYGAGSIVFTMGTDGLARGALERFARLIVERCAVECDGDAFVQQWPGMAEAGRRIRKLLEDE